ncbi:hypothetical protein A3860_26785 [Niastella vici]|uniref:Fibronectin type-III domain-containing protein n=2 Tax=Niastella vici TaxID=1703345 RepID=A0A1V9FWC5_9BACT|nr:hypothetical protein A3860_26785 [Niastella vici]
MSAFCLVQAAWAQVAPVDITVQLVPPYTSRIVDYVSPGNEKLRIIALQRDLTQASYRFFLRMEVSVNGQVLFRTSRNWQPTPITVAPGTPVILDGADLQAYFDANHLDFVNFNRDRYVANPNLPEGYTSICFTAYDYSRPDVAVSQNNCGNYFLALPEPPMLNYPACGMQVRALMPQQVIFSWVPMNMGNAAAQSTVYELSVYENRDNRNPNDIVQNVAPIYTTRTSATTVVYGPGEPILQTGFNYVWRVQAVDEKGQQAFKNNGFSQPCYFTYSTDSSVNWNNAQPLKIYALAMTEKNAKIGWQPDKDISYDKYTVYYRKQGNDNNWFNNTLTDTVFFVSNLEANTTYETRVQGIKGASSGMYSDIVHFTTPQKKVVDCKESAGILAAYNGKPYTRGMHNDIVHYGTFELTLDNIQQGQPGYYSGTGTVTIPFMLGMTFSVTFNNIQIDDAMQVTAGEVIFDSEGVDKWLASTQTVNTVIKNLSDGIKQLLNSTVNGDDKAWIKLEEQVKELAKQELPQVLNDSLNSALQQMDNARTAYAEAKQAYSNATTPEAKQAAQDKMDAAEKQFNDSKKTIDTLEQQKAEMANNVTKYMLKAIKQLKAEVDALQKDNASTPKSATTNNEAADDVAVVILRKTTITGNSGIDNLEDLSKARLKTIASKYFILVNSLFSYYGENDKPSFEDDNAIKGKELVKYAIDLYQQKVPEQELVQKLHDKLQTMLITISKQL